MAVDVVDAVVIGELRSKPAGAKLWPSVWPKVLAVAIFLGAWQVLVWTHWKPEFVVPSPFTVLAQFPHDTGSLSRAVEVTMRRAGIGFAVSILIGGVIGLSVARVRVLRAGIGSMMKMSTTMRTRAPPIIAVRVAPIRLPSPPRRGVCAVDVA